MNSNLKVLLYTLTGLAAGIGIGILLAPAAGAETRRKLKYSSENLKKRLGIDGNDFSDTELEMDATNGRSFGIS